MILRTLASGITFRLPVITCPEEGYKSFEFLQSQEAGVLESISKSFTILLKLNIIPNWFVIFITNDRSFRIIKVIWNR